MPSFAVKNFENRSAFDEVIGLWPLIYGGYKARLFGATLCIVAVVHGLG